MLVECGELTGPYEIEQFEVLLRAAPPPKDQLRNVNNHSIAGLAVKIWEHRSVASDHIAAQCAQVARLRDERGCTPEPHWYAVLGVLAYCDDGEVHGHDWSAGHPNYTHAETEGRLVRARTLSGATTCERFHSLDPKTCEACPHWQEIKSPISLGRIENAVPSASTAEHGRFPRACWAAAGRTPPQARASSKRARNSRQHS